ncbi:hypothetical protein [Schleiferia thermophila]|jgi:uncharacterized membrane protein|uniref:hypothetical protein n=1 Tax=Schleiferia thermophila TaxID=884107 RepID=UPI0004E7763E|nr:hypothetical protein [Schleiferia thermophila]KFD40278.1 hypothetical protein AT05_01225 [Schleiferia thermophila str. Yellowstone]
MKKILLITGIVLSLLGFFQGYPYVFDYGILTEYGKGYVWCSAILFFTGMLMIFSAFKIKKQAHNDRFSDDIDQTEPRI